MFQSSLMQEIQSRGFLHSCTAPKELDQHFASGKNLKVYAGFDCTADSLHVGNLMTLMLLRLFQRHGCEIIPLLGTATAEIGDPSGKDQSRPLLTKEMISLHASGITQSIKSVLNLENSTLESNSSWTLNLSLVEFLRDVGQKIPVNTMLNLESVKRRQDIQNGNGLSFLEFTYSLFQANDFRELNRRHGVSLQIGGSDQWGNITMGTELVRKSDGVSVFGLTHPLITNSKGEKFGKSAGNAVWLNKEKLSDFDFWQFWRNTEDQDVEKLLLLFTEIPVEDILSFSGSINEKKILLANAVTEIVRGQPSQEKNNFKEKNNFDTSKISPNCSLPELKIEKNTISVIDLLTLSGLCSSKSEARRMITQNAIKWNLKTITDIHKILTPEDWDHKTEGLLSKGQKHKMKIYF